MQGVYKIFLLICVVLAARDVLAVARQHIVTWDLGVLMDYWAVGQTFRVGDQVVFRYNAGLHSVLELPSETEYTLCDITNAVNVETNVVTLTKPGTRYFMCGTPLHCELGMKLQVKTVGGGGAPSSTDVPLSNNLPPFHPTDNSPPSYSTGTSAYHPTSAAQTSHSVAVTSLLLAPVILACLI